MAILIVVVVAPAAEGDAPALHTMRPGVPGEPQWVMLKLESTAAGAQPHVEVSFGEMRCPFVLHFAVLHGTPSSAQAMNSMTMNFVEGQGGVQVQAEGAGVEFGSTQPGASEACTMSSTFGITFGALPVGSSYFLMLAAGGPVGATAQLTAPSTVRVVMVSAGDETIFRGPNDFSGGAHVVASSPPTCTSPSLSTPGGCDPCCLQASGGLAGFDASVARSTTISFGHHPYLSFSPGIGSIGTSNATVTTPLGDILSQVSFASAGGVGLMTEGIRLFRTAGVVPGDYHLDIHHSVDVNDFSPPGWHAWAADIRFPEETV